MYAEDYRYFYHGLMFRLKDNRRVKFLVNAGPKTGTTWMVRLLSSLPGYRRVGNFQSDWQRYTTIDEGTVVHGHDWYSSALWQILAANGIHVVVTVRDPRDQAVSRLYHARKDPGHPLHAQMLGWDDDTALMASIEGGDGKMHGAVSSVRFTQEWIDGAGDGIITVRYEDLLYDAEHEVGRVLTWAGVDASSQMINSVVTRNRFSRLAIGKRFWRRFGSGSKPRAKSNLRKGISGDWKNHFRAHHCERFKELAGQALIELGYETDENW